MKQNLKTYGYVTTKDGSTFDIIEDVKDSSRNAIKLKNRMMECGIETFEPSLCLLNAGKTYRASDILNIPFIFSEDHPDNGSFNFLKILKFPINIMAVLNNSKFNSKMIDKIINTKEYLSEEVIERLILTQDTFSFTNFIKDLSLANSYTFFTKNPYRTKENMKNYESVIYEFIYNSIVSKLNDKDGFQLNFIDSESENCIMLYKLSEEMFDNKLDLKSVKQRLLDRQTDILIKKLTEIDDMNYIISSTVSNNIVYANKSKILDDLYIRLQKLQEEYSKLEIQYESLKLLFIRTKEDE